MRFFDMRSSEIGELEQRLNIEAECDRDMYDVLAIPLFAVGGYTILAA